VSVVAVVTLAINGVVQGDNIITEGFSGTIADGDNGGLQGANDVADFFGGGNLYGNQVTLSFSYDTDTLAANGAYVLQPSFDFYSEPANDAISLGVSINSENYAYAEVPSPASATDEVEDCLSGCGSPLLRVFIGSSNISGQNINGQAAEAFFLIYSTATLPLGSLASQSAIQNFINDATTATVLLYSSAAGQEETYTVDISSTPEPGTWLLLAIGIGGVVLLKTASIGEESFQSSPPPASRIGCGT